MQFPSQTLPETKKTKKEWGVPCILYGISLLDNRDDSRASRLYRSYNGKRSPASLRWITTVYGKESRTQFTTYMVGRAKQYLLEGEWLKRPLNATVKTINIQAKSDKMEHMDLMFGAMLAKEELKTLKNVAGVDVMEGAPVPEDEDDPLWEKMSPKDKQEDIMQVIVNEQIKELLLVKKFGDCFKDARIISRCFAKVEINEKGEVDFIWIDPRNAIYEEIEGDDFLERSVIKGARIWRPIHEVLMRYSLTDDERKLLEACRDQPSNYQNNSQYKIKQTNGVVYVEEIHVEWRSVKPTYYKIMPKTDKQLEYDSESSTVTKVIPAEIYEKSKTKYDKGVEKGEFQIEVKYEEDLWEGTSLGRMVFTNVRRKPFQMRPYDDPAKILDSSYIGCLFGTTDGVRVSLQELIENFDLQFDICEYQIMKELNRAKGVALLYDLAALPKNKTAEKLLNEIVNDGFATFNSMAAGNVANRNLDLANAFKELDLGFSKSFPQLLQLQNQILATLDRITGINEFREGSGPASSTVTNAQQGLANSRTITEPLFYMMQLFVEKVMRRIVEATKISWAFYKLDKGEQILGTEKFQYMKLTPELGYRDYGVHMEDGSAYLRLREKMDRWMEYGLNSKQISMVDAAKYELSESTIEAVNIMENAFVRLQQIQQQSQAQAEQNQMALAKQQQDTQIKIAQENREDAQQHDLEVVAAETQGQIAVENVKIQGKLIENQGKAENDLLKGN